MANKTIYTISDTRIMQNNPTTNYDTAGLLYIGELNDGTDKISRALLKFNFSDIPSNAVITKAELYLYLSANGYSSNNRTYRVYRQKRDIVYTEVTWRIYSSGNNWQTAGGFGSDDCEQTDIGAKALTSSESVGWKVWALDNDSIQEIVSGTWGNYNLMMKADTELNDALTFHTRENTNPPYIYIEYEPRPPKIKTVNGVDIAKVKTINGVDIAKVKSIWGIQ